jgi:acetyl-CoA C-acetyltransferase
MSENRDVVIVSGARTPIGTFGGALSSIPPTELATFCTKEAIARARITAEDIEHVVFGHVINTEPKDMYMARVAAVNAGIPPHATAFTVNRLCASGVQAIVSAAQSIKIGDAEIALAGGAETMSRAPHALSVRSGVKMGEAVATDMMIGVLTDPFGNGHMGITAENVAERYGVSRSEQDALALQSQQRAGMALGQKRFEDQIVPVTIKVRGDTRVISADEYPKPETTLETLSALRPAFKKDGTVTAGNASGINDGAAALVLMSREAAEKRHLKPLARIVDYAFAGVDPSEMGMGPVRSPMSVQGQSRPSHSAPVPTIVRYASNSEHSRHGFELTRCAKRRHRTFALK